MYRLQQLDARTLAMHWQRHKGGAEHERQARDKQADRIPAAIALGGDPAETWCASAPLPPNVDEYLLAGWLRGKPVRFVRAVSQPLEVRQVKGRLADLIPAGSEKRVVQQTFRLGYAAPAGGPSNRRPLETVLIKN